MDEMVYAPMIAKALKSIVSNGKLMMIAISLGNMINRLILIFMLLRALI